MVDGAHRLPLRHLSVRVPWHDAGWNGTVCANPSANAACLALSRIRAERDDAAEDNRRGQDWGDLDPAALPACVGERGSFMAPFAMHRPVQHPYAATGKGHRQFAHTQLPIPAYSALCIPFRWMRSQFAPDIAREHNLDFEQRYEDRADELIGFKTAWVQDYRNQLVMLDTFFSAVEPARSLCFFYVKQLPLTDDLRRVLAGVGRVTKVGPSKEYDYSGPSELRSVLWERAVEHSVRSTVGDGFLFPYAELLRLSAEQPEKDVRGCLAFAPKDHWLDFSYASEHVTHDAAISALLSCEAALRATRELVAGNWDAALRWVDARMGEVWRLRGPCPGLGSALCAFGVQHGTLMAHFLSPRLDENEDPWPLVARALEDPASLGCEAWITKTLSRKWAVLPEERRALLQVLSRMEISAEQAVRFYQPTEREKNRIAVTDREVLENPYLIYELDRSSLQAIPIGTVDRGLLPDAVVRDVAPLPQLTGVTDPTDPRRVRALVVSELEKASVSGDTLLPQARVLQALRELPLEPPCPVDADLMAVVHESMGPVVRQAALADGSSAYQLGRLADIDAVIRDSVTRRLAGRRHEIEVDWARLLDKELDRPSDDEPERRARQEKIAALTELAASRVSVLIGPAGTGKTLLLAVLCSVPAIRGAGVLLLAPTGKARVQMETRTRLSAQTLAQFLLQFDRYDGLTGTYRLSDAEPAQLWKTVIVDEASMLTEEQLGALLNGLRGVERLILVGDPRQLPPIGSGRPFVDIVDQLRPETVHSQFPRVGPAYCELTVRRRQRGDERPRDDLLLGEWFSGENPSPGADEIWAFVDSEGRSDTLRVLSWTDGEDLRAKLLDALKEELSLADEHDTLGFEQSLGGSLYQGMVYFHCGRGPADKVDSWQILSPVRGQAHGVFDLNRFVQRHFRAATHDRAKQRGWQRRIPRPLGPEEVLYGDKVINVQNKRRKDVFPEREDALRYVANGEIGLVVGQFKGQRATYKGPPWQLEVEFSSQPGIAYKGMSRNLLN